MVADPNYTPQAPADPYQGGEQSAERQKQALVQLLAEQGTYGAKQLQNRTQSATNLASSAARNTPAAAPMNPTTQALYDVFTRDAQQSTQQHDQEQARILAANKAYMDQVGAAVPMQRADNEAYTTAMRMQYEEAQRQREADLEQQRLASQRAAAASSAAAKPSLYDQQKEKRDTEMQLLMEDLRGRAPADRGFKDLQTLGLAGEQANVDEVAKAFGFNGDPANYNYRTGKQGNAAKRLVGDIVTEATQSGATYNEVRRAAEQAMSDPARLAEYGFVGSGDAILKRAVDVYLATYAPMWGILVSDAGFQNFQPPEALPWG